MKIIKANGVYVSLNNDDTIDTVFDADYCREWAEFRVNNADEDDVEWLNTWKHGMTREEMIQASIDALMKDLEEEYELTKKVEAAKNKETELMPEKVLKDGKVKVEVTETGCSLNYKYDWDFIKIMHDYKLKWADPVWTRKTYGLVSSDDLAAEMVNVLLNNGYIVTCSKRIADKAVAADYEPMPTRLIINGKDDKLLIWWQGYDEDLYNDARRINGSKWSKPYVVVKTPQYMDIQGFADKWGFVITDDAVEKIDTYKTAAITNTVKVAPAKVYQPKVFDGDAILNSDRKVMEKHRLCD